MCALLPASSGRRHIGAAALAGVVLALAGCNTIPPDALKLRPDSDVHRAVQTRAFGTAKEVEVLAASASVLQDLGFTLDESETKLGVIVATKEASAMNALDTAFSVLHAIQTLGLGPDPHKKRQLIRVSLVVRSAASGATREPTVRVTFQRRVQNEQMILLAEPLNDPRLYEEFFARLGKSVFLETALP